MANTPPPETEAPNRHVPPEIVEQILLNLPEKSLLRFSCVSQSWNSIVTSPQFMAKRGRETVIINDNPYVFDVRDAFCSPLSTVVNGSDARTELFCPFRTDIKLKAFCDELWCVVAKKNLYLWNPSTGDCKKLKDAPRLHPATWERWFRFSPPCKEIDVVYGLGYDSVDDDYKLLKIFRPAERWSRNRGRCLLYSLKSDSWREIGAYLEAGFFPNCNGLSVNGALHWLVTTKYFVNMQFTYTSALVSYDFSGDEFRVFQQPVYDPELDLKTDVVDVAVLRGKLCVFLNYRRSYRDSAFVLWAMEEYGVVESWTKLYEIRYDGIPPIALEFERGVWFTLRPLHVYEDGRAVIWACSGYKESKIIVFEEGKVVGDSEIVAPLGSKAVDASRPIKVRGGFVYMKSLVSPNMWGN